MIMLDGLVLDCRGHHPSCPKHGKGTSPTVNETGGHVDLFCDCHSFKEPLVLTNGTDIAWPAGWEDEQAIAWREASGLSPPENPEAVNEDNGWMQQSLPRT